MIVKEENMEEKTTFHMSDHLQFNSPQSINVCLFSFIFTIIIYVYFA